MQNTSLRPKRLLIWASPGKPKQKQKRYLKIILEFSSRIQDINLRRSDSKKKKKSKQHPNNLDRNQRDVIFKDSGNKKYLHLLHLI